MTARENAKKVHAVSGFRKAFGEAVLRLRKQLDMTQQEFAEKIGAPAYATILRLESEQAEAVSLDAFGGLMKVIRKEGMTFEQFLTGERPPVLGTAEELMQALAQMIVQERQRWERENHDVQSTHRPLTPSEWVVLEWLRKIDEQAEGKA